MANSTLSKAKADKKDEFYTQFYDIEAEMEAYLDYNPDVFRGKTVLLPCDDPEWSNFTKYFAQNFEELGLKNLIAKRIKAVRNYRCLRRNRPNSTRTKQELTERSLCLQKILQAMGLSTLMTCSGIILKVTATLEVMR